MKIFSLGMTALAIFAAVGCKARTMNDNFSDTAGVAVKAGNTFLKCKGLDKSEKYSDGEIKIGFSVDASKAASGEYKTKLVYLTFEGELKTKETKTKRVVAWSQGFPVLAKTIVPNKKDIGFALFDKACGVSNCGNQLVFDEHGNGLGDSGFICRLSQMDYANKKLSLNVKCESDSAESIVFNNCESDERDLKDAQKLL